MTVTLGTAEAGEPKDKKKSGGGGGGGGDDDPPEWLAALLGVIGAAGLGAAGSARRRRPTEGVDVAKSWDELARDEFAKPEEPIAARASDLSKLGAPVAASATVILAVAGGFASDADPEFKVIGAAVLVSVAVWGLFFVFATDFRTRSAVSVARFEALCTLACAEAKATDDVAAEAEQAKKEAKDAREQLDACLDRLAPSEDAAEPAPPATFLPLEEVFAKYGDAPTTVYGVESAGSDVVRYLVRDPDGRLRWVPAAKVTEIGGRPANT